MLKRKQSRLPKRLRRPVSAGVRKFVRKRHQRVRARQVERWKRGFRRVEHSFVGFLKLIRKWGLLALLIIFVGVFCFVAFSPVVQVRSIRVQRQETRVDIERVQHALAPLFGRHLLFLPTFEVQELLKDAVPDLLDVSVKKNYPSELIVRVQLRPIFARLTIENPDPEASVPMHMSGSTMNDYLTDNGIYVVSPLSLTGSTTFYIRDWTLRPVPGTQLLSQDMLNFLHDGEAALQQEFSMAVSRRAIYLRAEEVHFQVGRVSLWFDSHIPLRFQLTRLRSFLQNVPFAEVKTYIDLRLSGRVIYR